MSATPPCLLTYLFSTNPDPIQVSTPQTQVSGRVNTGVFSANQIVYCSEIVLAIPIGTDTVSLFTASPAGSVNTNKWAITSLEIRTGTELGLEDSGSYATFTYDCVSPNDYLINYNLVLGVAGQVNQTPGNYTIQIMELSGTTSDPSTFTRKQCAFTLTKTPPQFYLQNFVATAPNAPTVPATDFANGSPILFEWESNGAYFQLFMKNMPTPVYAGMNTTYTLTEGVSRDTTFILVASVSGSPGQDTPQGGYEPIYLYDSLSITISNPDLTPASVGVTGNATVGGTLGVTGNTTLANTTVGGTLGVTGNTTLANTTVGGTLGVTGNTTLANTTVGGALTATGVVGMLGAVQSVSPGSYTAKTDGFVVGVVNTPSDSTKVSVGWIAGSTPGMYVQATGGNVCFMYRESGSNRQWWYGSNPNSFMMPVKKGNPWGISVQFGSSNELNPPVSFYWIPIGSDTTKSFEKLSDAAPAIPQHRVAALSGTSFGTYTYEHSIQNLLNVLSDIFGESMSGEQKESLHQAIKNLVYEEGREVINGREHS